MPQLWRLDRKISKKKRGVSIVSDLTMRVSTGLDSGDPFWRTKYILWHHRRVLKARSHELILPMFGSLRLSDIQEMYLDKTASFDKYFESSSLSLTA